MVGFVDCLLIEEFEIKLIILMIYEMCTGGVTVLMLLMFEMVMHFVIGSNVMNSLNGMNGLNSMNGSNALNSLNA